MNIYKLEKIGKFFIYFSLFTPLFIVPFTLWEYVFVRNIIFYFLAAILAFLSFFYVKGRRTGFDFFISPVFLALAGFLIIRIISGLFGIDRHQSFWGSQPRMDGNLGYIMIFSWFASLLVFINTREAWTKLFKITVLVALMAGAFAVIQAYFPADWGWLRGKGTTALEKHRLTGTLGNSIFLAGYILPHIFLSILLFITGFGKKRYFWFASAFFLMLILSLTQTRGAIISFAVTSVFVAIAAGLHFFRNGKRSVYKFLIYGAPFLTITSVIVLYGPLLSRFKNIFLFGETAATRLMLWKIGWLGFLSKPIFGWGPENFSYIFSKFYNPEFLKYSFYETWADKPHNQFVEIISTTGIFGFVIFCSVIVLSLLALWKVAKKEKKEYLICVLSAAVVISYCGNIFFAFDTIESRMALFFIFAFIIFLWANIRSKIVIISSGIARIVFIVLCLASCVLLGALGTGAVRAAYYANRANEAIIANRFTEAKEYFTKLEKIKTPYQNGNWELLADTLLSADAVGNLPKSVIEEILPAVTKGLEKAATGNKENFSYHYRLAQMYNLIGFYLNGSYLDKAIDELVITKSISPKRQLTDLLLAQIYYYKRDVKRGVEILEQLVADNKDIGEPYWYLGLFYDAAGQYDKSYAYLTAAVDKGRLMQTFSEKVLYVTAVGRYNDYPRMEMAYKEILKDDKENPKWWANLAVVYLELKKYDEARSAARQAMFLSPAFGDEGEDFLKKIDEAQYGAQ